MQVCPNCALINDEGAPVCSSCGTRLAKKGLLSRVFGALGGGGGKTDYQDSVSYDEPRSARFEYDASPVEVEVEAQEDYRANVHNRDEAEGFNEQARGYLERGDDRRAIAACDEAIRRDPTYPASHYNKGLAYLRLQIYQDAVDSFSEAVRLTPDDAEAYSNRALALRLMGQSRRALSDYDQALGLEPTNDDIYLGRGAAHFDLGQFERSVQDFNEAIRLSPDHGYAYNNRAWGYIQLGKYAEAEQDIGRAAELGVDPEDLQEAMEELEERR